MISLAALLLVAAQPATGSAAETAIQAFEPQGFTTRFTIEIEAPVTEVFEAATGDVTGWWDHSFWPDPAEMVIEPRFDGRFYERFEAGSDNGTLHARVIFVRAPYELRLHGPLGLSGRAFDMVTSWSLEDAGEGDRTAFTVELHMAGEIDAEMAAIVRSVWVHFIDARLRPWVEADCHLAPDEACSAFVTQP